MWPRKNQKKTKTLEETSTTPQDPTLPAPAVLEPEVETGPEETPGPVQEQSEQPQEERPAPPAVTPPAPAPAPEPRPAPPVVESSLPWGLTPTRIIIAAATIPSLASLIWTVWSVTDMLNLGTPGVGLAVGVVMDLGMVGAVAMAWFSPAIATLASRFAWGVAALAAGAVTLHGWQSETPEMALFGVVPLVAKGLWHLALASRRAQEQAAAQALAQEQRRLEEERERERERLKGAEDAEAAEARADDASLTVEQRQEIAQIRQRTTFTKEKAAAEADEAEVQIEAANRVRMAQDRATADRLRARYELAGEVAGQLPIEILAQFMPGLGQEVATATASEVAHRALDRADVAPAAADMAPAASTRPVAGFGAELVAQARTGGTRSDLGVPPAAPREASPRLPRPEEPLTGPQRLLAYLEQVGEQATVKGAARELGVDPRTVRRYRDRLADAGHDMATLNGDQ